MTQNIVLYYQWVKYSYLFCYYLPYCHKVLILLHADYFTIHIQMFTKSKYILAALIVMLASCQPADKFRLKGKFTNLQQADFYVYSTDGTLQNLDTIHVLDGQFDWERQMNDEATLIVVYPNFSEQVIFAKGGDVIKMKGDANQLRQTEITGSKDNEELTQFRLQHISSTPLQLTQAMQEYVKLNPDTRVEIYLQRQLTLNKSQLSRMRIGEQLPQISLPPDPEHADEDTIFISYSSRKEPKALQHKPLIIVFWATWSGQSHSFNTRTRELLTRTAHADSTSNVKAISISLDVDMRSYDTFLKRDTVDWIARCYRMAWHTPVVEQLGLKNIPFAVLVDSRRRVVALGSDWDKDIKPAIDRMVK